MRLITKKRFVRLQDDILPIVGRWDWCMTKTFNNIMSLIQQTLVVCQNPIGKSSSQQKVPDIVIYCNGNYYLFRSDVIENSIRLVGDYDKFTTEYLDMIRIYTV